MFPSLLHLPLGAFHFPISFALPKLPHQACTAARNPCDSGVRHAGTHFSLEDAICGSLGPRTGWFHEDD